MKDIPDPPLRMWLHYAGGALVCALLGAAGPASSDVINACVSTQGSLRIVQNLADCKKSEAPLFWNIEGPTGPSGANGARGEPGPAGSVLRVLDATGRELGIFGGFGADRGKMFVFHQTLGVFVLLEQRSGSGDIEEFAGDARFAGLNCQGQAYFFQGVGESVMARVLTKTPPSFVYLLRDEFVTNVSYQSELSSLGVCQSPLLGTLSRAVPGDPFDSSQLGWVFPIPLPLRVEEVQ
jgi:hypothetical protein